MPRHRPIPEGDRNPATLAERFWARVEVVDGESSCWLWTGYVNEFGYGRLNYLLAPRISYWVANGEDPGGWSVCHTCDTPRCVRPEHLFLGSQMDNMQDAAAKGRLNPPITHDDQLVARMRRAFADGVSTEHIAQLLDMPKGTVMAIVSGRSRGGDPVVPPWAQEGWRRRGNQKLTDEQVKEIRERHAAGGISHPVLAAEFGVSRTQIRNIIVGRARRVA